MLGLHSLARLALTAIEVERELAHGEGWIGSLRLERRYKRGGRISRTVEPHTAQRCERSCSTTSAADVAATVHGARCASECTHTVWGANWSTSRSARLKARSDDDIAAEGGRKDEMRPADWELSRTRRHRDESKSSKYNTAPRNQANLASRTGHNRLASNSRGELHAKGLRRRGVVQNSGLQPRAFCVCAGERKPVEQCGEEGGEEGELWRDKKGTGGVPH